GDQVVMQARLKCDIPRRSTFARGAIELERNRAKLRLLGGDQVVDLIFEHYAKLSPQYRSLLPLKQIFVPDSGPLDR
ncbi:MAG: hypothetical protein MUP96_09755, partial [Planktomarina temperata]|nr:hypothetical protein [Planktomarina temperata]